MEDTMTFINSLFKPQEQWAMSYAENEPGMSMPEYHQEPAPALAVEELEEAPAFGATDTGYDNVAELIQQMYTLFAPKFRSPDSLAASLENFAKMTEEQRTDALMKGKKEMFEGAALRTAAAAGKFFDTALGIRYGIQHANSRRDIAVQNYDNQMAALDNQVLYIKHQLSDRFNKTVETNIMNLAARNLRVTAGNVLDLSKDAAIEITEDMRTAESNARLKAIALESKKQSAEESAKYAKKQLWTGLAQSAINLGLMVSTGGGTGEKFGDLYKGYGEANAYFKAKAQ